MANQIPVIYATLPNIKPLVNVNGVTIDLERYWSVPEEQRRKWYEEAHEIGMAKFRALHAEMDESWRKLVVRVVGEEATGRPAEEEYFSDLWHPQAEAMILVEYWGIYDKKMEEEMLKDNNAKLRKIAGDILKESGDEGRSDRRH